ncbi:Werner Syndrome-like exonuclease [Lolium rigidum]|uniref:Werner Syndrome-like exonuclease n=1 Tax=Lolium rigidum TaxID=89674 RepID=UPI001F5D5302|nr:Werner Syndrome-like exonuclease [Lolium rigidum]
MAITYHAPRRRPLHPAPSPRRRSTADEELVVMDDATAIRTTVTSSAYDVVCFLREVQARFREEVHDYNKRLQGRPDPEEQDCRHCLVVGLDTEWRQSFQNGKPRHQVAVIQLCVADRCLVYQVYHAEYIPAELADFLADPAFCFAAVGVDGDVKRLWEDCNLHVAHTMDLPRLAAVVLGRPELRQAGLKTLAREVMGTLVDKPKKVTMSRWAAPRLSGEQVRYACIDAFVSFDVGRRLLCQPHV